MPSSATGHHPDTRPKHVKIDEALWRECQAIRQTPGRGPAGHVDGCLVEVIDFNYVMVHHDMDAVEGGNGLEDPDLCGKNEIVLSDLSVPQDWPLITYHEAWERRRMIQGWSYARAHNEANDHERELRKRWINESTSASLAKSAGVARGQTPQ